MDAGWAVDRVDLRSKSVRFVRVGAPSASAPPIRSATAPAGQFEDAARRSFSELWGVDLAPGIVSVGGRVDKSFDLVSADQRIVGDAKWYTTTSGGNVPSAKYSVVAEYVWLLQQTDADRRFLVFGNDRAVPTGWLRRFEPLATGVEFWFLDERGLFRLDNLGEGTS